MSFSNYFWKDRVLPNLILGVIIAIIAGLVYGGIALYYYFFG